MNAVCHCPNPYSKQTPVLTAAKGLKEIQISVLVLKYEIRQHKMIQTHSTRSSHASVLC